MTRKCFQCNQFGHRFNECPACRLVHVIEEGEENPREGNISEDDVTEEFIEGDEGEPINCVIK